MLKHDEWDKFEEIVCNADTAELVMMIQRIEKEFQYEDSAVAEGYKSECG